MPQTNEVVVVLCTHNGAPWLRAQLDSIAAQTLPPARVIVSDDGSTDATRDVVRNFAGDWTGEVELHAGPGTGFAANFLSVLARVPETGDLVALSDQDDVWHPDKLARARAAVASAGDRPALHGGATRVCDTDLTPLRLSRITRVPLGFRHALTQNFAGGNTMVLNAPARALVQAAIRRDVSVPVHDWFLYQLVSGAGGRVTFDTEPCLDYRQHEANQIGDAAGGRALAHRLRRMARGDYRVWTDANLAALHAVRDLLTEENRARLDAVMRGRDGGLPARIGLMRRPGLYRQGILGQLGLAGALALRRF
ncbi:putative glycosyl transferase [Jannaschia seosinensis]|uniref:Putative glycosyl transferase n=1 Tax=Jannaschia seosinensis TaxID=313367 RepID=A0A0M7B8J0_9RHOB|nr:glycosyltransferase [Jannaschia seosinensis]CUH36760.1 putative glycosyl transferase [Jannaschia seosinensis]